MQAINKTMTSGSEVMQVAFYDMDSGYPKFSHAYPGHTEMLPEHWRRRQWTVSDQCPSLMRVTVCDPSGEHRYWEGWAGDTFHESKALSVYEIAKLREGTHGLKSL